MLKGIRVLAVEQYGAGPFGSQFLVDMGAEVIKIENPNDGGDMARSVGPDWHDGLPDSARSVFFQSLNRGKKSVTIDLGSAEGRQLFGRLVGSADAVLNNLRGDVPARLGLTYEHLSAFNPKVVCAHLSAYGREGERANWPGYDFLMQAETGYFELTGEPQAAPSRCGLSLVDLMTGSVMSMALLAGILEARGSGRGRDVDVSLFDLALYNLNYLGNWYLHSGRNTSRLPRSAHASLVPCQTYRTADGWIYLMCNKEKFWGTLCQAIDRKDWIADPRFITFKERLAHRDLLTELLDQVLSARTTAQWMSRFAGTVPASPIHDVKQALDNPWVADSDRIDHLPVPGHPDLRLLAPPVRFDDRPASRPAPAIGEHTAEILGELGLSDAELAALREARRI